MAEFKPAQPYILKNEGGYANVPGDKGGRTYRGISEVFYPKWAGWAIIDTYEPLKWNQIIDDDNLNALVDEFYKSEQWDKFMGDKITSQPVATYFYDFYVNAKGNAAKCLQRLVGVTADGCIGSGSVGAINAYSGDLLSDLHDARVKYYNAIGVGSNAKFLDGWLNRANEMYSALAA